jgi:hypothetical protein
MALTELDYYGKFNSNTNQNPTSTTSEVITTFDGWDRTRVLDANKTPASTCLNYSINKRVSISDSGTTREDDLIQVKNGSANDLGNWWIPSVGELFLIFKNYDAINAVLTELNNKTYDADRVEGVDNLNCALLQTNKIYWASVPLSE